MSFRNDIVVDWSQSPRIVEVISSSDELTVQDLYDTLRILASSFEALAYDEIVDAGGKEGGIVAVTMTLNNARVKFKDTGSPRLCKISGGNIFAIDIDGYDMIPVAYTNNVTVTYVQSTSPVLDEAKLWDESIINHQQVGSFGKAINDININALLDLRINSGRWKLLNTQMIFYAEDNSTEVARFDLLDKNGKLTSDPAKVYERARV